MAVKIRLKRMGKIRAPHYRVVVVDSRKRRDGRVIEEIGKYHPKEEPSFIEVTSERAQYWLGVGAQPTEAVEALLKITGDWQRFKGLPGAEGTLRTAEPKRAKLDLFNEALKDAGSERQAEAVTARRTSKRSADAGDTADSSVVGDEAAASELTPGVETPAGATAEAEAAEVKALDDERQSADPNPEN